MPLSLKNDHPKTQTAKQDDRIVAYFEKGREKKDEILRKRRGIETTPAEAVVPTPELGSHLPDAALSTSGRAKKNWDTLKKTLSVLRGFQEAGQARRDSNDLAEAFETKLGM